MQCYACLLRIQEVSVSNLYHEAGYPEILWVSSVPPGKMFEQCLKTGYNLFFQHSFDSLIRRFIIFAVDTVLLNNLRIKLRGLTNLMLIKLVLNLQLGLK
jgi:hypothetical protein